jgi:hypothetical protein
VTGGSGQYQYKWWIYTGTRWIVEPDWNSSRTMNWEPATPGSYIVAVWVRNAGVTVDASQSMAQVPFVITP